MVSLHLPGSGLVLDDDPGLIYENKGYRKLKKKLLRVNKLVKNGQGTHYFLKFFLEDKKSFFLLKNTLYYAK